MAAARRPLLLEQAMSLKALVSQVKTIPVGACVSYGRKFTASRPTRVATLPLGYADGYRRLLSNGAGHVLLNGGARAPVIGNVCMDMLMADVTDITKITDITGITGITGKANTAVKPGDEAVLLGRQGDAAITADDMAAALNSISYEVFCLLNASRLPKRYVIVHNAAKVEFCYETH
jgi:alanine racemase